MNSNNTSKESVTLTKIYNTMLLLFLVAFVGWSVFVSQRLNVMISNGANIELTSLKQLKYLAGLSYSAEEMEFLISLRNSLR